jgi:hypothetical protein
MPDHTPPRKILGPEQVDDLGDAVLALARELWVVTDRLRCLEAVLEKRGLDVTAELAAFEPDAALQAELDGMRDRLIGGVVKALGGDSAG